VCVSPSLLGDPLKAGLAAAVLMHGLLFVASTAEAAGLGDIDAGKKFAIGNCAKCHDITSRNPMNTASGAPTFYIIANTSGISRTSLSFWLQSSHPKMPGLMIDPRDQDNVIAFILSLKDQ
jgi:mono/diheme cytochrome c family protein